MSEIADFCARINSWLNREYSDVLVTSWVRMAEERLNAALRIADMVQIDTATIVAQRVLLPSDWQELDFVRVNGGAPIHYISRDEMYSRNSRALTETSERYTITGNYLILGGPVDAVDGRSVEVSYYGDLPQLAEDPTWVTRRHSGLLLAATMVAGSAYGIEDERVPMWAQFTTETINNLNENHKVSRISGSVMNSPRRKGFG